MGPDRIGSLDRNKLEIFASDIFSKFGFQRDDCFLVQNSTAPEKLNLLSYQAASFILSRSKIKPQLSSQPLRLIMPHNLCGIALLSPLGIHFYTRYWSRTRKYEFSILILANRKWFKAINWICINSYDFQNIVFHFKNYSVIFNWIVWLEISVVMMCPMIYRNFFIVVTPYPLARLKLVAFKVEAL